MTSTSLDLIVIGGGLSGLTAARVAHEGGLSVRVLEASGGIGGRIRSLYDAHGHYLADLGPSWVWPPYQPVVAAWIERLGVETLPQFEQGDAVIDLPGRLQRARLPGQDGIRRLRGGPEALVRAMHAGLPEGIVVTGSPVHTVSVGEDHVEVGTSSGSQRARFVIVATPPRVLLQSIHFEPELAADVVRVLEEMPTWMAPQAKGVYVYERPFWRDRGLSGRIASRVGPLVEVHDMSNDDGRGVLFGFVGVPHAVRRSRASELQASILAQLARCLGPEAARPLNSVVQDWATEPHIASELDLQRPAAHPERAPESIRQALHGRVWLAGAEAARVSPGLIEGALEAGERTAQAVLAWR